MNTDASKAILVAPVPSTIVCCQDGAQRVIVDRDEWERAFQVAASDSSWLLRLPVSRQGA